MTEYQYKSPKTKLVSGWIDAGDERRRTVLEASGWTITATRGAVEAPAVVEIEPFQEAPSAVTKPAPARRAARRKRG